MTMHPKYEDFAPATQAPIKSGFMVIDEDGDIYGVEKYQFETLDEALTAMEQALVDYPESERVVAFVEVIAMQGRNAAKH